MIIIVYGDEIGNTNEENYKNTKKIQMIGTKYVQDMNYEILANEL